MVGLFFSGLSSFLMEMEKDLSWLVSLTSVRAWAMALGQRFLYRHYAVTALKEQGLLLITRVKVQIITLLDHKFPTIQV